eukprot:scaffold2154_cov283-Chaetoceros_neogracile.AAC.13
MEMEERMRDTILYLPTLHDIPQKIQSISTSQKSKSESNTAHSTSHKISIVKNEGLEIATMN